MGAAARTATAPASGSIRVNPAPGYGSRRAPFGNVRQRNPAIRAPASYRLAALAGPCAATETARHLKPRIRHSRPADRRQQGHQGHDAGEQQQRHRQDPAHAGTVADRLAVGDVRPGARNRVRSVVSVLIMRGVVLRWDLAACLHIKGLSQRPAEWLSVSW